MKKILLLLFTLLLMTFAQGAVGDIVHRLNASMLPEPGCENFCSIGLAFDGSNLYYNRCDDANIYAIDPLTGALADTFDTNINTTPFGQQGPNAMAYDATREGIWFGTQSCDAMGMPIYFWNFSDDSMNLAFHVPFGMLNPATNQSFLNICFLDGLAFNANGPGEADDELWFSDDVDADLGVFRTDGTLVAGYDATAINDSLSVLSGLAVGGPNLYMGNNGFGDVFRADIASFTLVDQFASEETRLEDMECDPDTFAPTEVMWVRHTPQGVLENDLITAFEIEPGACGLGGVPQEEVCDGVDNDNNGVIDDVDADMDGVNDCREDMCLDSTLDNIPLNPNQYAQNNLTSAFEVGPNNDQSIVYDMVETMGCTCTQIVEELGAGKGHLKKGCSPSIMEEWTGLSANPDRQEGIGRN